MRYAIPLILLSACSSLSSEQQEQLALFQRTAKFYYEGARYEQAMGQVERGLELAPDDYLLSSLKGAVLLKLSGSSQGQDHRALEEATQCLANVYDTRAANRHEPYLLLSYGLALQKQGRRMLGEMLALRDQATRSPDPAPVLANAELARKTADERLSAARDVLMVLVERGEVLRQSHYHLLLIAQDMGDQSAFDKAAKDYLLQLAKDEQAARRNVEKTDIAAFEQNQLQALRDLRGEELDVRGLLAENHYARKDFTEALEMLSKVLELDPSRSVDYYNRGRVLIELNRAAEAKEDFRRFLSTTNLPADNPKTMLAAAQLRK